MKVKTNHFNVTRHARPGPLPSLFSRWAKRLGLRRRLEEVIGIDRAEAAMERDPRKPEEAKETDGGE